MNYRKAIINGIGHSDDKTEAINNTLDVFDKYTRNTNRSMKIGMTVGIAIGVVVCCIDIYNELNNMSKLRSTKEEPNQCSDNSDCKSKL